MYLIKNILKSSKLYLVFLLVSICACAQDQNVDEPSVEQKATDRPSVHGMLLMGNNTVYASHLPMFHSPHHYQVILELALKGDSQDTYLSDRIKNPQEAIYTIAPEVFVLPEKVAQGGSFKANIYRGHFERGGIEILKDVEVEISKVVYFKKFTDSAKRPEHLQYLLFGNQEEQFLAHLISKKPDFDEVLQVALVDDAKNVLKEENFMLLEFPEKEMRKPFSWNTQLGKIIKTDKTLELNKVRTLYLEHAELD